MKEARRSKSQIKQNIKFVLQSTKNINTASYYAHTSNIFSHLSYKTWCNFQKVDFSLFFAYFADEG